MNTSNTQLHAYEQDRTAQFRSGDWMRERRRETDWSYVVGIVIAVACGMVAFYSSVHPLLRQVQNAIEGVMR